MAKTPKFKQYEIFNAENSKSRYYKVNSKSQELKKFVKKKFKSLTICYYELYKIRNVSVVVLHLGFDIGSEAGPIDYEDAKTIKLKSGNTLHCVPDEDLDDEGNFVPKIDKKIFLEGVPFNLASSDDQLKQLLDQFAILYSVPRQKWVSQDSCYDGKIVVPVKEFKIIKLPLVLQVNMNGQTLRIRAKARGNSVEQSSSGIECFTCKKNHYDKDCPVRKARLYRWRCTVCGTRDLGCYQDNCKIKGFKKNTLEKSVHELYEKSPNSVDDNDRQIKLKNLNGFLDNFFDSLEDMEEKPGTMSLRDYHQKVLRLYKKGLANCRDIRNLKTCVNTVINADRAKLNEME